MKTTVEVPDELYLQVKSRAALRRRKIKDYVEEGLRLALEADATKNLQKSGPLSVFDEVRNDPLHRAEDVEVWIEKAREERVSEPWRDEA